VRSSTGSRAGSSSSIAASSAPTREFRGYEERKDQELAAEEVVRRRFDKFWAQEEVWIRKGVEARRTRNEGRVKRLERLRNDRAARLDRLGNVRISLDAGERPVNWLPS